MVAVTFGTARVAAPAAAKAEAETPRKSLFARMLASIEQAQMKRAQRDLARYRELLPLDHELRGGELVPHRQGELPFGGR